MNFLLFNFVLLFASFPAALIFSIGLVVCMAPVAPFLTTQSPAKWVAVPAMVIAASYQVYFWGLWAAFCVAVTLRVTQKPEVTWDWVYWICAFSWCSSLLGWMSHKERQSASSAAEANSAQAGAMLYSMVAVVAFLLFGYSPSLAAWPYGWFLNLLGLGKYMVG